MLTMRYRAEFEIHRRPGVVSVFNAYRLDGSKQGPLEFKDVVEVKLLGGGTYATSLIDADRGGGTEQGWTPSPSRKHRRSGSGINAGCSA